MVRLTRSMRRGAVDYKSLILLLRSPNSISMSTARMRVRVGGRARFGVRLLKGGIVPHEKWEVAYRSEVLCSQCGAQ